MRTTRWLVGIVLVSSLVLLVRLRSDRNVVMAQTRKPIVITRLYTGPDGLTHAEDMDVKLAGDRLNEISEMFKVTGAELHRTPPGKVNSWHTAPRRQFVITLSGRGEIELAGGKRFCSNPDTSSLPKTSPAKVTSPESWATRTASPFSCPSPTSPSPSRGLRIGRPLRGRRIRIRFR